MKKQKIQFLVLMVILVIAIGAYFGVDKYVAYVDNKAERRGAVEQNLYYRAGCRLCRGAYF